MKNIMKKTLFAICLIAVFIALPGFAESVLELPEVLKPISIQAAKNRVYITDGTSIHIYSLKPFKHLKKFGRKGEGPSEFKRAPYVTLYPGYLFINDSSKFLHYSLDGKFIKEIKMPFHYFLNYPLLPVGENHTGIQMRFNREKKKMEFVGKIYGKNLALLKEYYDAGEPSLPPPPPPGVKPAEKIDFNALHYCVDFDVSDGKIYIADSRKGMYAAIFDANGKLLKEINIDSKKLSVTKEFKEDFMKSQREHPQWEQRKKLFNFVFPEYYPAFFTFKVKGDKLYFATYDRKDGNYQLVVADMNGKSLKRSYSFPMDPFGDYPDFFVPFSSNFDIADDTIFYLEENDDKEMWELHIKDIK